MAERFDDTDQLRRVDALLGDALSLPREQRARWLESLEPRDAPNRPILARLLERADATTRGFMGRPAVEVAAEIRAATEEPGDRVGPYVLVRALGEGGMGTVWEAERPGLQRRVALKLPRRGWEPGFAERLVHECQILSVLEHPGIARLYDAGVAANGRPYLAMELIAGMPIDAYCNAQRLDVRARLALFLQVAAAISYAHARLVVHRDLKPANLLIDAGGRVHVVDFGLGKLIDHARAPAGDLTTTLGRTLTPDYASPEQIRGEPIGVASDVYSLGIVLYELLAGRRPYRLRRESTAAIEEAIAEADIPLASTQAADPRVRRELRGDLDTILAKALRKDVAERYPTMDAFADDVERHLRGLPVLARPARWGYRAGRFVRRNRLAVAAGAAVLVAVVAGVAGTMHQAFRAEAERARAVRELEFAEAAEAFMRFLLSEQSARPLPAAELLARAEAAARVRYQDSRLRARMQIIVSELYAELREYGRAEAVLDEARKAARAGGDADAELHAECESGGLLFPLGRGAEGLVRLDAAIARIEARGDVAPQVRRNCYMNRAAMNRQVGRADEAARDARLALAAMGAPRPGQETARAFAAIYIAYPLIKQGRFGEALALFDGASTLLADAGLANTAVGHSIASNRLSLLVHAGQLARAEQAYENSMRALSSEASRTPFQTLRASLLVYAGRYAEALAEAEEVARVTREKADRSGESHSLLWGGLAACGLGDVARCAQQLERVEANLRPALPATHPTFAILDTGKAQLALLRGRPGEAIGLLEDVARRLSAERSPHRMRALSLLAIARQRAGDAGGAREAAASAVRLARSAMAGLAHSEWLGSALLVEARIHHEQGDRGRAATLLAEARRHLAASVGPDSVAVRRAVLVEAP